MSYTQNNIFFIDFVGGLRLVGEHENVVRGCH